MISTVFLLLVIYTFGVSWETLLPKRHVVEGTRFEWLGPTLYLINPGKFKLKEVRLLYQSPEHVTNDSSPIFQHVTASIIASSASSGSTSVLNFAVQRVSVVS